MPWHVKASGSYSRTSTEAADNANMIYGILYARGWTVNAVAGLLGNVETESGYNPWRWQADNIGASSGSPWTNKGYGLYQFTPASKYIDDPNAIAISGYGPNFSDRVGSQADGYAQTVYIDGHADYYATSSYPLSFANYKASTDTPQYLASTWLYNYERPADPVATENRRREAAAYWYQILSGEEPPPDPSPGPSPGPSGRKLPLWMYARNLRLFR